MASFKDLSGKEHFLTMTVGFAEDLKEKTDLDFVEAVNDVEVAYGIIRALDKNIPLFCEVIHTLGNIEGDLKDFTRVMGGDQIADAFEALDQSFTDFYRPGQREAIATMKENLKASMGEETDGIVEAIDKEMSSPEFKASIKQSVQKAMETQKAKASGS